MKEPGGRMLAGFAFDRDSEQPLYRQLAHYLRDLIVDGSLRAGMRLPSTRTLIEELGVSRATIITAFEQLGAEGFLETRRGDGTYIAPSWGEPVPQVTHTRPPLTARGTVTSARGQGLFATAPGTWAPRGTGPFVASQIAVEAFPAATWRRLVAHHAARIDDEMLTYCDSHGYPPLREAIADYVSDVRGVVCDPAHVVITSGTQHALTVLALLLLEPGDTVIVEDPGHIAGRMAFQAQGCQLESAPVDADGAVAPAEQSRGRLAYLTPSRQHPLGMTMGLSRRMEWIGWAGQRNTWIVEDDGDSELRYRGRLLPTLYGLDRSQHVLYVGSFSKVLSPSIRIGYAILPPDVVDPFADASAVLARPPATMMQAALADFLNTGGLHAHLRRTRRLYSARQDALLQALEEQMGDWLRCAPVDAGLHLMGWLPEGLDDRRIAEELMNTGVYTFPLSDYQVDRETPPALLIGFAGTAAERMDAAVRRFASAFHELI